MIFLILKYLILLKFEPNLYYWTIYDIGEKNAVILSNYYLSVNWLTSLKDLSI